MRKFWYGFFLQMFCAVAALAQAPAQIPEGAWEGEIGKSVLMPVTDVLRCNFIIKDSVVTGISYLYHKEFGKPKYEIHSLQGKIDKTGKRIILREQFQSANSKPSEIISGVYTLALSTTDSSYVLIGHWNTKKPSFLTKCKVRLEQPFPKTKQPLQSQDVLQRKISMQGLVEIPAAQRSQPIKISVYDNGEIDGDSISLYYNGQVLVPQTVLGTRPIVVELRFQESAPVHELVMVAHNLGRLPPNTGLMVIEMANGLRQELSLKSDFGANATVRFVWKN